MLIKKILFLFYKFFLLTLYDTIDYIRKKNFEGKTIAPKGTEIKMSYNQL